MLTQTIMVLFMGIMLCGTAIISYQQARTGRNPIIGKAVSLILLSVGVLFIFIVLFLVVDTNHPIWIQLGAVLMCAGPVLMGLIGVTLVVVLIQGGIDSLYYLVGRATEIPARKRKRKLKRKREWITNDTDDEGGE